MDSWLTYRPDIDGLRALAIIAVFLFHAGVPYTPGGFVGVDVFFVISGFLITRLILANLETGRFSYTAFLLRRARRILPIMFVTLFLTGVASYALLLFPGEVQDVGRTLISQSFLVSNIQFMLSNTYFGFQAANNPLLHMWTLSVEEQFYVLFPLLMMGAFFFRKRWSIVVALITLLSLSFSIYLINLAPGGNILRSFEFITPFVDLNTSIGFYFLASRAWELLIGALIVGVVSIIRPTPRVGTIVAAGGLALILYSIFSTQATMPFPGAVALLPTIGAAFFIWSGTGTATYIHRLLSLRPLVFLGLVSYSFYLWHWPLLVFLKTYGVDLDTLMIISVFLALCALSYFSYRFIEQPFRKKQILASDTKFILAIGTILIALVSSGYFLMNRSAIARVPHSMEEVGLIDTSPERMYEHCQTSDFYMIDYEKDGPCFLGVEDPGAPVRAVLWGDSHARVLSPVIDEIARENGTRVAFFAAHGCIPIPDVGTNPPRAFCTETNRAALNFIETQDIKKIILAANWDAHIHGWGDKLYNDIRLIDASEPNSKVAPVEIVEVYLELLSRRFLSEGRQLFILEQMPIHKTFNRRDAFYYRMVHGALPEFDVLTYEDYLAEMGAIRNIFDRVSRHENVHVLDPARVLCENGSTCDLVRDETVLYYDRSHLNYYGTVLLRPLFQGM